MYNTTHRDYGCELGYVWVLSVIDLSHNPLSVRLHSVRACSTKYFYEKFPRACILLWCWFVLLFNLPTLSTLTTEHWMQSTWVRRYTERPIRLIAACDHHLQLWVGGAALGVGLVTVARAALRVVFQWLGTRHLSSVLTNTLYQFYYYNGATSEKHKLLPARCRLDVDMTSLFAKLETVSLIIMCELIYLCVSIPPQSLAASILANYSWDFFVRSSAVDTSTVTPTFIQIGILTPHTKF